MTNETVLSAKQRTFATEYMVDRNATQAAIRAGYSARSAQQQGSRLLCNDVLKQQIAVLESERREAGEVDRSWVITKLRDFAENGEKETNRLRAAELLGKSVGLFTEHIEIKTTHDITPLAEFSIEELRVLREQHRPAIEVEGKVVE